MHHRGRLAETSGGAGRYAGHSEGHSRRVLVDGEAGSVHQEVVVAELARGGRVDRHLHAFEEAIYILDGRLTFEAAGSTEQLDTDDYVFVDRGVAHALGNGAAGPCRWFEVSAPPPGGDLDDTVFVAGQAPKPEVAIPYRRAHFDVGELPEPSSALGLAGFGNAALGRAALESPL